MCNFVIAHGIHIGMRNISEKKIAEKIKTQILCSVTFYPEIAPFMKVWKNMVQPERTQMTI